MQWFPGFLFLRYYFAQGVISAVSCFDLCFAKTKSKNKKVDVK